MCESLQKLHMLILDKSHGVFLSLFDNELDQSTKSRVSLLRSICSSERKSRDSATFVLFFRHQQIGLTASKRKSIWKIYTKHCL
jgi:hypothetical protein